MNVHSDVRFLVVAIHNREENRLVSLRRTAGALNDLLGGDVVEVFEQPPYEDVGLQRSLAASLAHDRALTAAEELVHQRQGPYRRLRRIVNAMGAKGRRRRAIEVFLFEKHVAAWQVLLDGTADAAVVLESDALLKSDTVERLGAVLEVLQLTPTSRVFLDLAGAFPFGALPATFESHVEGLGIFRAKPPWTNTTAAYLLTRELAQTLLAAIEETEWIFDLPVDWALNLLFHRVGLTSNECLHPQVPLLLHGSQTHYASTIR